MYGALFRCTCAIWCSTVTVPPGRCQLLPIISTSSCLDSPKTLSASILPFETSLPPSHTLPVTPAPYRVNPDPFQASSRSVHATIDQCLAANLVLAFRFPVLSSPLVVIPKEERRTSYHVVNFKKIKQEKGGSFDQPPQPARGQNIGAPSARVHSISLLVCCRRRIFNILRFTKRHFC